MVIAVKQSKVDICFPFVYRKTCKSKGMLSLSIYNLPVYIIHYISVTHKLYMYVNILNSFIK